MVKYQAVAWPQEGSKETLSSPAGLLTTGTALPGALCPGTGGCGAGRGHPELWGSLAVPPDLGEAKAVQAADGPAKLGTGISWGGAAVRGVPTFLVNESRERNSTLGGKIHWSSKFSFLLLR